MENGKRFFDFDVFQAGMKLMDEEFDFSHSYLTEARELLKKYIGAVHYFDDESKKSIQEIFRKNRDIYLKSDAVYIYLLYDAFNFTYSANSFEADSGVEQYLKILKKVLPTLDSDLAALTYLTEAIYLENLSKFETALQVLSNADRIAVGAFLPEIKSEILNTRLRLFIAMGRAADALEVYEDLRSIYERENNYSRMLTLHCRKATIYMLLNSFQKADYELNIASDRIKK